MEYKKYTEIIDKILNSFEIPREFGRYYGDEKIDFDFDDFSNKITKIINKITPINICYGVSKMVIVPKKYPFVIKIPFNGYFSMDTSSMPNFYIRENSIPTNKISDFYREAAEKREDWIETHLEDIVYFESFECACEDNPSDYCLDELQKYQIVTEKSFSPFFAGTYYYTAKNGRNIYIQEKAIAYCDSSTSQIKISKGTLEKAKKMQDDLYSDFPREWLATAIECYGETFVTEFLNYVSKDEDELYLWEDMHCGNLGYRLNGTPCIIDFSGWRD